MKLSYKYIGTSKDDYTLIKIDELDSHKTKIRAGQVIESSMNPQLFTSCGFVCLDIENKDELLKAGDLLKASNGVDGADESVVLATMSVEELRAEADIRGIIYNAKIGKKNLIAKILEGTKEEIEEEEIEEEIEEDVIEE